MLLLVPLILSGVSLDGCGSHAIKMVGCLIINLQYINCTWDPWNQQYNYSFYSKFGMKNNYSECPHYLWMNSYIVGCQMPYTLGQRFDKLHIKLSHGNSSIEESHDLQHEVKLNTPHNLSVEFRNSTGLWFTWNITELKNCIESVVQYKKDAGMWTVTPMTQSNYFNVPLPSEYSMYTFQVKVRISDLCSLSEFWSDWSSPVSWGPVKSYDSETSKIPSTSQVVLYSVLGGMILFALACVLIQYERLKVIFIPTVPNPGKNLEDLFITYNGNVEEWLHISKEFVDGFKPNFSESVCPVREYLLLPQGSESSSECSLLNLTDLSNCLSTSCFTCTSTLPVPLLQCNPPRST